MAARLKTATSPYLRAHADNPVDWYPWGPDAFAEAARRDVPVMVSIGYSTCHWCHVMARESFADDAIARRLAAGFVAVKVDREEHPEVDAAYMAAAGAFTRDLGWPLTAFATPEGRVFYAGTYFPPEPRAGLPSLGQVLDAVGEAWTQRRDAVEASATELVAALTRIAGEQPSDGSLPELDVLVHAAQALCEREDPEYGGFGTAGPKFPMVPALSFLQAPGVAEPLPEAPALARRALQAMAASDLRDPVEGGFFRYATRRDWSVPHYERMLTDNAGLLQIALDAGDVATAAGIARFLTGVMRRDPGGFGAAQDSESWIDGTRSEGGYYARGATGRAALEAPAVDGKLVTEWNGMAIAALSRAGTVLGDPSLVAAADDAARAVLAANAVDDTVARSSLDGVRSSSPGTDADYGRLAEGLVALAVATGEAEWAERARRLVDAALGGAAAGDPVLVAQGVGAPESGDGDHGSGRAALAHACLSLWQLGAGQRYRDEAARLVAPVAARALAEPLGFGSLLRAAAQLAVPPRQLVVFVIDAADPLAAAARGIRTDVTALVTPPQSVAFARAGFALFEGKTALDGRSTAYDCRGFTCRLPITEPDALIQ